MGFKFNFPDAVCRVLSACFTIRESIFTYLHGSLSAAILPMDEEKLGPDDSVSAVLVEEVLAHSKRRKARERAAIDVKTEDDAVQIVSMKIVSGGGRDRRRKAHVVGERREQLQYAHGWRSGVPHTFRPGDECFPWVFARSLMKVEDRVAADRRECEAAGMVWLPRCEADGPETMARACNLLVKTHTDVDLIEVGGVALRWYCGITGNPLRRWRGFRGHDGKWTPGHARRPGGPWVMHVVAYSTKVGEVGRAEKMVVGEANRGRPQTPRGWVTTTTGWGGNTNRLPGGEGDGFGVGPWYIYVLLSKNFFVAYT